MAMASGSKCGKAAGHQVGEALDLASMRQHDGFAIRVLRFPVQIEQGRPLAVEASCEAEGVLDEPCHLERSEAAWLRLYGLHRAKPDAAASLVANLFGVGGREVRCRRLQVLGALGLDRKHTDHTLRDQIEVRLSRCAQTSPAHPLERKLLEAGEPASVRCARSSLKRAKVFITRADEECTARNFDSSSFPSPCLRSSRKCRSSMPGRRLSSTAAT